MSENSSKHAIITASITAVATVLAALFVALGGLTTPIITRISTWLLPEPTNGVPKLTPTPGPGAHTPPTYDLSTPVSAANAFFAAVEKKDIAGLERIISTRLHRQIIDKRITLNDYVEGWRRTRFISISHAEPVEKDKYGHSMTFVHVDVSYNGQLGKEPVHFMNEHGEWRMDGRSHEAKMIPGAR